MAAIENDVQVDRPAAITGPPHAATAEPVRIHGSWPCMYTTREFSLITQAKQGDRGPCGRCSRSSSE